MHINTFDTEEYLDDIYDTGSDESCSVCKEANFRENLEIQPDGTYICKECLNKYN